MKMERLRSRCGRTAIPLNFPEPLTKLHSSFHPPTSSPVPSPSKIDTPKQTHENDGRNAVACNDIKALFTFHTPSFQLAHLIHHLPNRLMSFQVPKLISQVKPLLNSERNTSSVHLLNDALGAPKFIPLDDPFGMPSVGVCAPLDPFFLRVNGNGYSSGSSSSLQFKLAMFLQFYHLGRSRP